MSMSPGQPRPDPGQSAEEAVSLKEFLEKVPPVTTSAVREIATEEKTNAGGVNYPLHLPVLELHCDTAVCSGIRLFEPFNDYGQYASPSHWKNIFTQYRCRN